MKNITINNSPNNQLANLRDTISAHFLIDEKESINNLLIETKKFSASKTTIQELAKNIVELVRNDKNQQSALDALMQEYDLSSQEGVLLMCLAEALLRIPDKYTAEKLIKDKLADANWESHIGNSSSLFVNASSWGLMLTGKIIKLDKNIQKNFKSTFKKLVNKSGEPVIRLAIRQAMKIMGHQFVMGRTIETAIERAQKKKNQHYRYSFDMLGEAALTANDAEKYFKSYQQAIKAIGKLNKADNIIKAPSISVKLSALFPRYEHSQKNRVMTELPEKVISLAQLAVQSNIGLTIDAEEADRLELSLDIFEQVFLDSQLSNWNGLGLAVQTYQKRAPYVIEWLAAIAKQINKIIPVRLVKGAYWDTEIKHSQELGLSSYPVYTKKNNTDLSYLICARKLLAANQYIYAQFATHNAQTVAAIVEYAKELGVNDQFEFQRLHGMGQQLYDIVLDSSILGKKFNPGCRVYAPVGSHEDLLPYLVRRLLENGANTSFVNRITDEKVSVSDLTTDPINTISEPYANANIPLPVDMYQPERKNSTGISLADPIAINTMMENLNQLAQQHWHAYPLVSPSIKPKTTKRTVLNPANVDDEVGYWQPITERNAEKAINTAINYQDSWNSTSVQIRAKILAKTAELLTENQYLMISLCIREAGKTIADAIAEVREAIDFCYYYAQQATHHMEHPVTLPGPTGESNHIQLHGKGTFVCISPWNFPLAIFMGQISAALAAGNTVLAKPAEQTNLIAYQAVKLLHEAGIPTEALQLLPGDGASIGNLLTSHSGITGIAFTGSTETAKAIHRNMANHDGPIGTLIAETGGQNAMIVDSSALPEQVVKDVLSSAFSSAGQRCSALRVLFIQDDIADKIIEMLIGAMNELKIGNPGLLETDIGPVIDQQAHDILLKHVNKLKKTAKLINQLPIDKSLTKNFFFPPTVFEIQSIDVLKREVFGPIVHIIRYKANKIDQVINSINNTGYGLTLGIHSRINSASSYIQQRVKVGNCYINRNQIGAMVGVQPFGGEKLSGTGPKAGGPHYLLRFTTERAITNNTAAIGGNASLLALTD